MSSNRITASEAGQALKRIAESLDSPGIYCTSSKADVDDYIDLVSTVNNHLPTLRREMRKVLPQSMTRMHIAGSENGGAEVWRRVVSQIKEFDHVRGTTTVEYIRGVIMACVYLVGAADIADRIASDPQTASIIVAILGGIGWWYLGDRDKS